MTDTSKKLYIVYLVGYIADIAGGQRVIIEHVNRLHESGHRVEIWTSTEGSQPYFECKVPVMMADFTRFSEPDIVVLSDPIFAPEVCPNRQKGGTFLLLQHDNEWVVEMELGADAVPRAGFAEENLTYFRDGRCSILVVSSWLRELVKERYGLDSHLVLNGVNPDLFHPSDSIVRSSEPAALVLYDPQVWKGFNEATLAALEAQKLVPDLQLMILGRYLPQVPQKAGQYYGFALPVTFFNRPRQSDLARVYASASVFVSASWKEGFGLPGLEAMACGIPIVTTDAGGNRDYAIPDETAVVVPAQDINALAEGMVRVLNDAALREKLVANGLKKARELNWEQSIRTLEAVFDRAAVESHNGAV